MKHLSELQKDAQCRLSEIALDFDFGKSEIWTMEPASSIISRLGGEAVVSRITDTAFTAPYRWQHPREKGGTGGTIPQRHHPALLQYARAQNIPLAADDFLPPNVAEASPAVMGTMEPQNYPAISEIQETAERDALKQLESRRRRRPF